MRTKQNGTEWASREGLSDRILQQLVTICGTKEIRSNPDLALYDKQVLDSMKTVELILAIEEEFGLYVSPAELDREKWATPGRIVADIEARLKT